MSEIQTRDKVCGTIFIGLICITASFIFKIIWPIIVFIVLLVLLFAEWWGRDFHA